MIFNRDLSDPLLNDVAALNKKSGHTPNPHANGHVLFGLLFYRTFMFI